MSLMEGATLNMILSVDGICGAICSCATCHCYIPDEWQSKSSSADKDEEIMFEGAPHRRANSRLGCQMRVTKELDGMRVQLPEQ
ncbi:MAG: 2Fe-2S ferredoxin [Candidatus Pseudothioglobus sp.]|jgi:2Fe-2S ferredoxin